MSQKEISPLNMTDLPTSPSNLLTFINGHAIACYGDADAAKKVKPSLLLSMKVAVQRMNNSRRNRDPPFDHTTDDDEVQIFIIGVFYSFSAYFSLSRISATFASAWIRHYYTLLQDHFIPLEENLSEFDLSLNIKLPSLEETDEVAQAALDKISDTLFDWYLDSLRLLASKEQVARRPVFPPSLQGRLQPQENMSTIPVEEWDAAWNTEFRGHVLKRLELKLHLNVQAITNDQNKHQMSRIIPVVQASGTGKSRLAEE